MVSEYPVELFVRRGLVAKSFPQSGAPEFLEDPFDTEEEDLDENVEFGGPMGPTVRAIRFHWQARRWNDVHDSYMRVVVRAWHYLPRQAASAFISFTSHPPQLVSREKSLALLARQSGIVNLTKLSEASAAVGRADLATLLEVLSLRLDDVTRAVHSTHRDWYQVKTSTVEPRHRPKRADELSALVDSDSVEACRFLMSELATSNIEESWRDVLLLTAERLQVVESSHRERLANLLFEWATRLSSKGLARDEGVLWATIRRAVSLSRVEQLSALELLLSTKVATKTRQVALQALAHKFTRSPGPVLFASSAIGRRIKEMCEQLLNDDVLTVPQSAALGLSALVAAATIALPEFPAFMKRCAAHPLLARQASIQIRRIAKSWDPQDERAGVVLSKLAP